ncbi:elongator complex protein 3 [Athalassotoga saccharophila]|uniref:elongator complex protein 3 n=1 Tax=Athalassotoga saccharophila TaxID=1441386 RepID=UPI00137A48BB|nr:radical SAM protein [Athalassotoga saccharophila]BBJ27769.1 oxygen-independent coproporphyrinogen-III oxidase-like protein YqeR [Athalassotoga saccharophila]
MKVIPIFFPNAGCKHRCVFCNEWMATMKTIPVSIEDEVVNACRIYHADEDSEIGLYGGTFTAMENWREILKTVHDVALRVGVKGIRISTRPDEIKDVDFLVDNGVMHVEIGAQSMVERVLVASKRNHTAEDVVVAARRLKEAGIKVSIHLMTGLPNDSKRDDIYSAFEVAKLRPDSVRIHPTLVLKNTELERLFLSGDYVPQTLDDAVDVVSDMITIFKNDKIQIERIGMYQDSETIVNVVAGPYHPAFGEMALSAMYKKFIDSVGALGVCGPKNMRSQIIGRNRIKIPFEESEYVCAIVRNKRVYFDDWAELYVSRLGELIG